MRSSSEAGVTVEAGPRQRAQPVAREQHHRAAALLCGQRLRVLHVGGGEHFCFCASGDLVLQQAGCAELRLHLAEACGFESLCHLGQRGTQAAGGVEQDRFLCHCRRRHDRENRESCRKPCGHHAPESLALG